MRRPTICVVTAGHLSTAPRMVKAADALTDAGYDVRVVSTHHVPWAAETDRDLRANRAWRWTVVDYDRRTARGGWIRSGMRTRLARTACMMLGNGARVPAGLAARANIRAHVELTRAALVEPADLYYGGSSGGLLPAALAARRLGARFMLDLEDFHSAEQSCAAEHWRDAMNDRVLRQVLPGAAALTTSSRSMAAAYAERYGVVARVIHNTFPLPEVRPDPAAVAPRGLRLYWFSQTVGPGRGLEDVVQAMGLAGLEGELHLRGRVTCGYLEALESLRRIAAPALTVVHHPPAAPDQMIALCGPYDIGLAVEVPNCPNHNLALSNKALTYPLAALAVVLSDTSGHRELAEDLGDGAFVYRPGDIAALAGGLTRWATDRASLVTARAAAWAAAERRWHWEHPGERDALVATVTEALR